MWLLRLFGGIVAISASRALAYRADLLFQVVVTATGSAAGLATLGIVYAQTTTLAGWSAGEAIVLLGTYQVVSGLLATFVEPNLGWFANKVRRGELDDYLLQPVPSILLASLRLCWPLSLAQVVMGCGVVALGAGELARGITEWGALVWLVMLVVGLAIGWAFRLMLASLAFWAPYVEPSVLYNALWQLGRYPVNIYRQPIQFVLTYILPIAFIATVPARALTRGVDASALLGGLAVGTGTVLAAQLVWRAGLRRYTSATS